MLIQERVKAGQFIAVHPNWKAAYISESLRTLRRALSLACERGKLGRKRKISLAKGKTQKESVLSHDGTQTYLAACPQPWKDAATIILGTGITPGECCALRWEHVLLGKEGGLIQIAEGKSKAARRMLPMVPDVLSVMRARHGAQGCPMEGRAFPSKGKGGARRMVALPSPAREGAAEDRRGARGGPSFIDGRPPSNRTACATRRSRASPPAPTPTRWRRSPGTARYGSRCATAIRRRRPWRRRSGRWRRGCQPNDPTTGIGDHGIGRDMACNRKGRLLRRAGIEPAHPVRDKGFKSAWPPQLQQVDRAFHL